MGEKRLKHISSQISNMTPLKTVFITWDLTYNCNYSCSYCSLGYERQRARKPKTTILSPAEWGKIWKDVYERYGSCQIHFTGGEPFAYPGIMEILENITGMHTFECSTNLFWEPEELMRRVSPARARIGSSFHPEMESLKVFRRKVEKLKNNGYEVWVNYVAYPPFLNDLKAAKDGFREIGVNMSILPFNGEYRGVDYPDGYNDSQRDMLRTLGADLPWVKKTIDFSLRNKEACSKALEKDGFKECWMGVVYAKIHPDGNVFRCCAEGAERLGNIINGDFRLLEKPCRCPYAECPCWKAMVKGEENEWGKYWPVPPGAGESEK